MKGGNNVSKNYQELVKNKIFIGGAGEAKEAIENEGIDVVIDLRAEILEDNFDFRRVHIPIVDDSDEQQDDSVKIAIDRVAEAYNADQKVYFHCAGGSNRTGTVAIGTLLALGAAKTIEEAENKAMTVRPKINVKPQLKESLKRIFPDA